MSVALLVRDATGVRQRLLPVAPQATFRDRWLPGIEALKLDWIQMMETGFDVTAENRTPVLDELQQLRSWMCERPTLASYEIERLGALINEIEALRFDDGATAFLG